MRNSPPSIEACGKKVWPLRVAGGNPFSGWPGSDDDGPAPPEGVGAEDCARADRHPVPPRGAGGVTGECRPRESLREPRREDWDAVQRPPAAGVQAAILPEVPRVPGPRQELPRARLPREGDDDVRRVRGCPPDPVRTRAEVSKGGPSIARRHVDLPRLAGHVLSE